MLALQAIGRLGKDAEVKNVGGKTVINFSVGVDVGYGDKKEAVWLDCAKWGENTKVAEYLKKGTQVHVAGEPSLRHWESNGKAGVSWQLRVQELTLVGSKGEGGGAPAPAAQSRQAAPAAAKQAEQQFNDDLPF